MAVCYAALRVIQRKRKRSHTFERILKDYQNPFSLDDKVFKDKFCFSKKAVQHIFDLVAPIMKRHIGYPVVLQVLFSLQILRTGKYQHDVGGDQILQVSQPSISKKFDLFLDILIELASKMIEFPNPLELAFVDPKLYGQSKIPNIIGVINCFQVYIHKPKVASFSGTYYKRREKCSVNVQLVCDSDLCIIDVVSHWPGSTANSDVWKCSSLRSVLKDNTISNQSFLVGDSSFPLEPWLLHPYEECHKTEELVFNDHIHRALDVGTKCLAALRSRFKCLDQNTKPMRYNPEKCSKIVMACMVLHNIAIKMNLNEEDEPVDINEDDYQPSAVYSDVDSDMEETMLRNEGMAIRDGVARQLLTL